MSAIAGIGGGLGLVLGGVLVDRVSYHWIFWLGAAMGLMAAISAQLSSRSRRFALQDALDVRGALVLAVGLVLPLIAISQAPTWVGAARGRSSSSRRAARDPRRFWVVLERRTPQPLADIEALAKTPVLMTNIATLLVGFGMFGSFILIPTLAQAPTSTGYGFGVDATRAGLLLVPGALMMLGFGPLSGIIGSRSETRCRWRRAERSPARGRSSRRGAREPGTGDRLRDGDVRRDRARLRRNAEPDH